MPGRVLQGAGCGTVLLAALLVGVAAPAAAQTAEPRVFVTFGLGMQAGGGATTDRLEWEEHFETATADVDYGSGSSRWLGGGAGVRLWRQFGAGVAFSRADRDGAASIEARIPHPFHFNQPREISGEAGSLTRSETGVHVQVLYILPATGRVRLMLSAGPSRIETRQDTVTAVRFAEEFPFDTATFQRADTRSLSASAIGFNAGVDAAFMFTRALGVGATFRFARASMDLVRPDGGRLSIDAGGVQAGAGLRVSF